MSFSQSDKTSILRLKSSIASYYNLQMKKIGDHQLGALLYDNCIITGGCIASLFHGENVNDIDVYAKTKKAMTSIKDYIIASGKNIKSGSSYKLNGDISTRPLVTENAVTLTNDVQFIYLGTADVCRANFDFVHCMPWYDIQTQKLYISEAQFTSIKNKRLVYNLTGESIKDRRIQKYIAKGWQPYVQ
jgi:hypothetical protein